MNASKHGHFGKDQVVYTRTYQMYTLLGAPRALAKKTKIRCVSGQGHYESLKYFCKHLCACLLKFSLHSLFTHIKNTIHTLLCMENALLYSKNIQLLGSASVY